MVGGTGLENVHASEQKLLNSDSSLAQNSAESNTSKDKTYPGEDKSDATSIQEKDTLLHEKCAISVHQNSPELELIIKAWPNLSEKAKKKIMAIIAKVKSRIPGWS